MDFSKKVGLRDSLDTELPVGGDDVEAQFPVAREGCMIVGGHVQAYVIDFIEEGATELAGDEGGETLLTVRFGGCYVSQCGHPMFWGKHMDPSNADQPGALPNAKYSRVSSIRGSNQLPG